MRRVLAALAAATLIVLRSSAHKDDSPLETPDFEELVKDGQLAIKEGNLPRAIQLWDAAVHLQPNNLLLQMNLGTVMNVKDARAMTNEVTRRAGLRHLDAAMANPAFRAPPHPMLRNMVQRARPNMAKAFYAEARRAARETRHHAEAAHYYRQAIVLDPMHARAAHYLSALVPSAADADAEAPRDAVSCAPWPVEVLREYYDAELALKFDAERDSRGHAAARLLRAGVGHAVDRLGARPGSGYDGAGFAGAAPTWEVVDVGCGTGRAGPVFRDMASRLVGIDVSADMLARAKVRGVYDDLEEGSLTSVFARRREALAADRRRRDQERLDLGKKKSRREKQKRKHRKDRPATKVAREEQAKAEADARAAAEAAARWSSRGPRGAGQSSRQRHQDHQDQAEEEERAVSGHDGDRDGGAAGGDDAWRIDMIVAADVVPELGSLSLLLSVAAEWLRQPHGLLAFTTLLLHDQAEARDPAATVAVAADGQQSDAAAATEGKRVLARYRTNNASTCQVNTVTARYRHSPGLIQSLATAYGFEIEYVDTMALANASTSGIGGDGGGGGGDGSTGDDHQGAGGGRAAAAGGEADDDDDASARELGQVYVLRTKERI